MGTLLKEMDEALTEFTKLYPNDKREWDAQLLQIQVKLARAQVAGLPPDRDAAERKLRMIAGAAHAPVGARAEASFILLQLRGSSLGEAPSKESVKALDNEILAFIEKFPNDPRSQNLRFMRVDLHANSDPAKSNALLKELTGDKDPRVAQRAQARIKQQERAKQPLDLKYTAVSGTEVDLAKMRGKVVLVDFWATWCGPCRAEVPNVVAAYKKYREKGFEVVGVSLDESKDDILQYTKEQGMTWPQHFDGRGWKNEIAVKYGIQSIPAMWLVDKKGMIRSTNARGPELAKQIEKLLSE
jgi:thiol-disulfide isomerase/thioredoxin